MTEITENCIRLQKSFPNFLHSSHALHYGVWLLILLRKEQMQMKLVFLHSVRCLVLLRVHNKP